MQPYRSDHVKGAARLCRIIEANGDSRRQAALGVSSQMYKQDLLPNAKGTVLLMAARLAIAEDVLQKQRSLFGVGLQLEYEAKVRQLLAEGFRADL